MEKRKFRRDLNRVKITFRKGVPMKEERVCTCGLPKSEHKELEVRFFSRVIAARDNSRFMSASLAKTITDFEVLQGAGAKNGCIAFRLEEARLLR